MTNICDALEGTTIVVAVGSTEEVWTELVTMEQPTHVGTSSKQNSEQTSNSRIPYCSTLGSPKPAMTSLTWEALKYSARVWSEPLELGRLLPAS